MDGDIVAREAVIAGEVHGDISAFDRIEVTKSASIVGDLTTSKILIEEGAYFKGGIEIGQLGHSIRHRPGYFAEGFQEGKREVRAAFIFPVLKFQMCLCTAAAYPAAGSLASVLPKILHPSLPWPSARFLC